MHCRKLKYISQNVISLRFMYSFNRFFKADPAVVLCH